MTHSEAPTAGTRKRRGATDEENPPGRRVALAVLVVVLLVGSWPYLGYLQTWPTSRDATVWIWRGAPVSTDWLDWCLTTQHFKVGYRPVAALSYSVDYLVGGFDAWPYRVTDLGLHLACGLLVYLVYRRFGPGLPRWGGLVAAALFVAHPVVEQVVPHLARRSYTLATAMSLAALFVLCPRRTAATGSSARQGASGVLHWVNSLFGGLLLAGAVLSNEVAYMTVVVLPLLLHDRLAGTPGRWKRMLSICALPAALVVFAFIARAGVIGGVGGYVTRSDQGERAIPIAQATWRTLGAISSRPNGGEDGALLAMVAVGSLVGAYYAWRAASGPFAKARSRAGRLGGILLAWLAGYTVLFALLGVWFPRQVYVVLVPFVLLVAVTLVDTMDRLGSDRLRLAGHLLPQVLLLGWVLVQSPVVRGPDPLLRACWRETNSMLRDLVETLRGLPDSATVRLAVPRHVRPRVHAFGAFDWTGRPPIDSRQPRLWAQALLSGHGPAVESLLLFDRDPVSGEPQAEYRESDHAGEVVLAPASKVHVMGPGVSVRREGDVNIVRIDPVVGSSPGSLIYFHDGERGRLIAPKAPGTVIGAGTREPEG